GKARPQSMEVRTGQFALHPRYGSNGRITGWQGLAELVLEGRDFGLISRTAAGLNPLVVSGSGFSLSRQARQQLESDVQREAISQFRGKADDIAKAFGFTGYTLRQVNVSSADGGQGQPRPMIMMAPRADKAMEADLALPVEAGKDTVQVTVAGSINLR
ncbi:MAG: SIMPL domain-containing protein, partial [Gammaproteobacteria bacterium]